MVPCYLYLTPTIFIDATIITYELELPPAGRENGFNLLDEDDFTIPYIIDTIANSLGGHKITTQAKNNMWIVAILLLLLFGRPPCIDGIHIVGRLLSTP